MQVHDNAGGIGRTLGTLAGKAVAAVQGTSETVKEQVNMHPVFCTSKPNCPLCLNVVLDIIVGEVFGIACCFLPSRVLGCVFDSCCCMFRTYQPKYGPDLTSHTQTDST